MRYHPLHATRLALTLCSLLATLAGMRPIAAQVPVFSDTFENGSATDSEAIAGFWTLSPGDHCSVAETGGKLLLNAGDATSPSGMLGVNIYSGNPVDDFNFFRRKLRFSVDISLGINGLDRFALKGQAGSHYVAPDALAVVIDQWNTVTLAAKENQANTSVEGVSKLVNASMPSTVTGFELTLDATDYTLLIYYQGGSKTYTGKHLLVASQWGTDGKTALQFEHIRGTSGSGAGTTSTTTLDNLLVVSYATPAVFEDCFNNGSPSNSDSETGIWTATLPQSSAVSEATGAMQITSCPTGLSYLVACVNTPVQARFNFFDNPLKVTYTGSVSGTASQAWLKSSKLSFISEAKSSIAAKTAIWMGLTPDKTISFGTKMNGAGVIPEDGSSSSTYFPLEGINQQFYSYDNLYDHFELKLNGTRYEVKGYASLKDSGTFRYSGSHKLDRSKWGANGDSSLALESVHWNESGTYSGTTAVATFDNLRVEQYSSRILDEPFWTFTATYSTPGASTTTGSFRLWLPSTEPVIRGIILCGPGDGGNCAPYANEASLQEAARMMGFGIIGYTTTGRMNLDYSNYTSETESASIRAAVQKMLDRAATVSSRPEISNAALCITGVSRGAFDSGRLAYAWPERVVAYIPHCGGLWSSATLPDAGKKVPGFFVTGSADGNGLTYGVKMKTMFGWLRSQDAQVAYCVDWNVGHGWYGNVGFEASLYWMVEVAKLRYPRPMVPSQIAGTIPTLVNLVNASGWLGDNNSFSATNVPTVTSSFTTISSYASYAGTVSTASWLPNESLARMYRAVNSSDMVTRSVVPTQSPLRIVSPAQFADPILVGASVTIAVDPREFGISSLITSVDFYDGATWLGAVSSGPAWQWTFTPTLGAHSLSVVATDALGNKRDAFRVIYVQPTDYPPVAYRQSLTAISGIALTGTVSGSDPEGKTVTYAVAQQPSHGTVSLNATTGAFTYQANLGYGGTDTFTFTATDGTLTSDPTHVDIAVAVSQVGSINTVTAVPGANTGEITLTWSAATDASSYYVERSTLSNSGFVQTATLSAPTLTYTDANLTLAQSYFYRVKAVNSASTSAYSSTVSSLPDNPPSIDSWRYYNFGSTSTSDGAGDLDIPYGDGVTNLMKYALGMNFYDNNGELIVPSPTDLPYVKEQTLSGSQYLTCTFTHNKNASDLTIVVEVTSDPAGTWTTIDPFNVTNQVSVADNTPSTGIETIIVKDTQPTSAASKRFMRVRVTH